MGLLVPDSLLLSSEQAGDLAQNEIPRVLSEIMPLFGVTTIEALKEKVQNSPIGGNMRYSEDYFNRALGIRDSIKVEDIGSLN